MYSSSIKLDGYDLQNVPTSTGRADMLIRVMKNALYLPDKYNSKIGFLLFPNQKFLSELAQDLQIEDIKHKGFLISSKSQFFTNNPFKITSEHKLLQALYDSFLHPLEKSQDSLFSRKYLMNFHECISSLVEQGIPVYILHEEGSLIKNFDQLHNSEHERICIIVGDQVGFSDIDLEALPKKIIPLSLGKTSFLGSTTVTLIKWMIWFTQNTMHKP